MPKKKAKASKKKKTAVKAKKKAAPARKAAARRAKPAGKKSTSVKKSFRPPAKLVAAPQGYRPASNEKKLGEVEDFFGNIGVIALTVKEDLAVGNTIHVRGHTTDLTQKVDSMQINHVSIPQARKGDSVGIKVTDKCRKGDEVYRVD